MQRVLRGDFLGVVAYWARGGVAGASVGAGAAGVAGVWTASGAAGVAGGCEHPRQDVRLQQGVPGGGRPDRVLELPVVGVLEQVAAGAGPQAAQQQGVLVVGGQDHHGDLRVVHPQPLGGLDAAEMRQAADMLKRIRDERGITIVWVEHIMGVLLSVVDRVLVLDHGAVIFEGTPRDAQQDEKVAEVYLGPPETRAA